MFLIIQYGTINNWKSKKYLALKNTHKKENGVEQNTYKLNNTILVFA